jgi:hypothetical protein
MVIAEGEADNFKLALFDLAIDAQSGAVLLGRPQAVAIDEGQFLQWDPR